MRLHECANEKDRGGANSDGRGVRNPDLCKPGPERKRKGYPAIHGVKVSEVSRREHSDIVLKGIDNPC